VYWLGAGVDVAGCTTCTGLTAACGSVVRLFSGFFSAVAAWAGDARFSTIAMVLTTTRGMLAKAPMDRRTPVVAGRCLAELDGAELDGAALEVAGEPVVSTGESCRTVPVSILLALTDITLRSLTAGRQPPV